MKRPEIGLLLMGLLVSAPTVAQTSLKSDIVGAYTLVSLYDQMTDGKKNDTWGPGVHGSAFFAPSGRFSVEIIGANRDKAASKSPRTPVGPMVTYLGTYTVENDKTVIYHIERSSFPAWDGTDRKFTVAVTKDGYKASAPVHGDAAMGDFTAFSEWKRD